MRWASKLVSATAQRWVVEWHSGIQLTPDGVMSVITQQYNMDNFKETTLKGHIQLCELRYKSLEQRLENVEQRLAQIEDKVNNLGSQIQSNLLEIKLVLQKADARRDVQIIATLGTIVVAIIGAVLFGQ